MYYSSCAIILNAILQIYVLFYIQDNGKVCIIITNNIILTINFCKKNNLWLSVINMVMFHNIHENEFHNITKISKTIDKIQHAYRMYFLLLHKLGDPTWATSIVDA